MDIQIDYWLSRHSIPNGSIVLFRGASALSKTIQWADNAYFNHSELVFWAGPRLMCIGANANGVNPRFLSNVIDEYKDFEVLIPNPKYFSTDQVQQAVDSVLDYTEKDRMEYDYFLLPRILVYKKLHLPVKREIPQGKTICSMFTAYHYGKRLGVPEWSGYVEKHNFFTPQDHLRIKTDKFVKINVSI